jgi:hypothetical protein
VTDEVPVKYWGEALFTSTSIVEEDEEERGCPSCAAGKTASLELRSVQRNVLTARPIDIRNIKKGKTEKKSWYRYVFSESPGGAAHRERTRGSKPYLPFLVR